MSDLVFFADCVSSRRLDAFAGALKALADTGATPTLTQDHTDGIHAGFAVVLPSGRRIPAYLSAYEESVRRRFQLSALTLSVDTGDAFVGELALPLPSERDHELETALWLRRSNDDLDALVLGLGAHADSVSLSLAGGRATNDPAEVSALWFASVDELARTLGIPVTGHDLVSALEAAAVPDADAAELGRRVDEALAALRDGAPTLTVNVSSRKHRNALRPSYRVRRTAAGGVLVSTAQPYVLEPLFRDARSLLGNPSLKRR